MEVWEIDMSKWSAAVYWLVVTEGAQKLNHIPSNTSIQGILLLAMLTTWPDQKGVFGGQPSICIYIYVYIRAYICLQINAYINFTAV